MNTVSKIETGQIYVAELTIPAYGFVPIGTRHELPVPKLFGLQRGFFSVLSEIDSVGTERPSGFKLVCELVASDRTRAEDGALAAARVIGEYLNFIVGSPASPVKLLRVGKQGLDGGLVEQHEYQYRKDHGVFATVELPLSEFNRHLTKLSKAGTDTQWRIQLAIRWYGMSLSAEDPVDKYLALWIGLESIAASVSKTVHENGPRAACTLCDHVSGKKRDHKFAGLTHIIAGNAPEILKDQPVADLAKIRNQIAHGIKSQNQARQIASDLILDLELCLGSGILTLLARSSVSKSTPGTWYAVPSRDYEKRPDLRFTITFRREMKQLKPYFGDWFKLDWNYTDVWSRLEKNGQYILGSGVEATWEGHPGEPTNDEDFRYSAIAFERRGIEVVNKSKNDPKAEMARSLDTIPQKPWRERDLPESWKKMLNKATKRATELSNKNPRD